MDITQMHSSFRVIGQQMGMQLNRGILPESIDTFINAEIGEFVQTELLTNAHTVLQDNVNLQSMTMSPINLFRTLYRKDEIPLVWAVNDYDPSVGPIVKEGIKSYVTNIDSVGYYKVYIPNVINCGTKTNNYPVELYDKTINYLTTEEKAKLWVTIKNEQDTTKFTERSILNPMLYLGVSIATKNDNPGQYKSCRLIGANTLETTLRDYCNGADKNNPIAVLLGESKDVSKSDGTYDKTINAEYFEIYTNTRDFKIDRIYISYIKYPNIVHWSSNPTERVDCDLPEYIHYRIVEGAVRRFLLSIGGVSSQDISKSNKQINN